LNQEPARRDKLVLAGLPDVDVADVDVDVDVDLHDDWFLVV